jgi:ribonucleotide monophosphatase NagD (HAD superfamily)
MHKNRWWLTPDGPDDRLRRVRRGVSSSRPGSRRRIVGKPAREFFTEAANALAAELRSRGERPLRRRDILMVGDDLETDVRAAQRAGLRGAFVLTASTRERTSRRRPSVVGRHRT